MAYSLKSTHMSLTITTVFNQLATRIYRILLCIFCYNYILIFNLKCFPSIEEL